MNAKLKPHSGRVNPGRSPSWSSLGIAGWLLAAVLLPGCSKTPEKAADETRSGPLSAEEREIALRRGRAIASETFDLLRTNLQSAIQTGGISNALPYCSLAASPLTAGMAVKHGVTLRRVTHRARQATAKADANELGVLQAFEVALAGAGATNPPPPVVTNLVPGSVTFFAPILIGNELCLRCHGEPGRDIAAADLELIQRLYAKDEAVGFKLGQLRGAWRIEFPRATLAGAPAAR